MRTNTDEENAQRKCEIICVVYLTENEQTEAVPLHEHYINLDYSPIKYIFRQESS